MKCKVQYYLDSNNNLRWQCPNSMGTPITGPAHREKCWRYNCKGRKEIDPRLLCKAEGCQKLRQSPKSLYCNNKCKSRESSRKYRLKKKNESLQSP